MNVMEQLKLDHWYKAVGWLGGATFIAALTLPLQVPNAPVALMGLGAFFVGIGEWRNHPLQTRIQYTPVIGGLKITGHPRNASLVGTMLDLIGLALLGLGAWKLLGN